MGKMAKMVVSLHFWREVSVNLREQWRSRGDGLHWAGLGSLQVGSNEPTAEPCQALGRHEHRGSSLAGDAKMSLIVAEQVFPLDFPRLPPSSCWETCKNQACHAVIENVAHGAAQAEGFHPRRTFVKPN